MIKAIAFDFGGVITKIGGLKELREEYCKLFGIPYDVLTPVFRKNWYLWRDDKLNETQFWENISKELGFDYNFEQVKAIMRAYHILNKDVMSFVKQIKGKYKIYILSNHVREWFGDAIKRFGFEELFDGIFTSYDVKVSKPEKEIYLKFLERFGIKGEECAFIDDRQENVKAADELGIKGIMFTNFEQMKSDLKKLDVEV